MSQEVTYSPMDNVPSVPGATSKITLKVDLPPVPSVQTNCTPPMLLELYMKTSAK